MEEITDYRTGPQKERDARNGKIYCLYWKLRKVGVAKHRACELISQKFGLSTPGVTNIIDGMVEIATTLFNEDGTITLSLKDGQKLTFEAVSEAVNFCLDREIDAKFITIKTRKHVDQKKAV